MNDVNMEESNIPQADSHPAGSMTPAQHAQTARNGSSTPAQEEEFPNGPSRTPQSDPTPEPTVTRRVTNKQLREAVKVAMLQQREASDGGIRHQHGPASSLGYARV